MEFVSAIDFKDEDITDEIVVKYNNVDTSKPGNYKVVYEVKDNNGDIISKEIN